jgi:DNA replication ATP-dependent helicase Dna2
LKVKQFGTLIVDEATQILEPMIVGLLSHFDKWILIGDENQLPAVTQQSTSAKCNLKSLNDIGLYSFAESLFLRLKVNAINKGWDDCYGMLQYHYRMHEKLAEFVNNEFYNNKLIPKTNRQKNKIVGYNCGDELLDKIFSNNRVAFISTPIQNSNKINDYEAKLVARIVEYVHKIYGDNFDYAKSLGVITPFKAQILNIKKYLKPEYKNITIDTVERYQGSERDIIIISFALNNPFMIFSVKSESNEMVDRKLNVALTRAKDHLVLIGNDDILKSDPIYHKLLKYIEKENGIYRIGNSVDW